MQSITQTRQPKGAPGGVGGQFADDTATAAAATLPAPSRYPWSDVDSQVWTPDPAPCAEAIEADKVDLYFMYEEACQRLSVDSADPAALRYFDRVMHDIRAVRAQDATGVQYDVSMLGQRRYAYLRAISRNAARRAARAIHKSVETPVSDDFAPNLDGRTDFLTHLAEAHESLTSTADGYTTTAWRTTRSGEYAYVPGLAEVQSELEAAPARTQNQTKFASAWPAIQAAQQETLGRTLPDLGTDLYHERGGRKSWGADTLRAAMRDAGFIETLRDARQGKDTKGVRALFIPFGLAPVALDAPLTLTDDQVRQRGALLDFMRRSSRAVNPSPYRGDTRRASDAEIAWNAAVGVATRRDLNHGRDVTRAGSGRDGQTRTRAPR